MATGEGRVYAKYWNGYDEVIAEDTTSVDVIRVVIVTGPSTSISVCEEVPVTALGQPPGGTYEWSISSGSASLTNVSTATTAFKADSYGIITIDVAYNYSGTTCAAATNTLATFPQLSSIDEWNDPDTQSFNNCYNFAVDMETDTFAQPGNAGGYWPSEISCSEYAAAAEADGLTSGVDVDDLCGASCLPEGHIVALVIWPGVDFHWYRMESDGTWSHKPGRAAATRLDNSGNLITDPWTADRGNYTVFCGFFCVGTGVNIQ